MFQEWFLSFKFWFRSYSISRYDSLSANRRLPESYFSYSNYMLLLLIFSEYERFMALIPLAVFHFRLGFGWFQEKAPWILLLTRFSRFFLWLWANNFFVYFASMCCLLATQLILVAYIVESQLLTQSLDIGH